MTDRTTQSGVKVGTRHCLQRSPTFRCTNCFRSYVEGIPLRTTLISNSLCSSPVRPWVANAVTSFVFWASHCVSSIINIFVSCSNRAMAALARCFSSVALHKTVRQASTCILSGSSSSTPFCSSQDFVQFATWIDGSQFYGESGRLWVPRSSRVVALRQTRCVNLRI